MKLCKQCVARQNLVLYSAKNTLNSSILRMQLSMATHEKIIALDFNDTNSVRPLLLELFQIVYERKKYSLS